MPTPEQKKFDEQFPLNKPAEWIEYTGSDEQIEEIEGTKGEVLLLMKSNYIIKRDELPGKLSSYGLVINKYFIGNTHPYADLIKIWADTGCPVYWRSKHGGAAGACHENFPPFAHPNEFEYLLTPFED